MIDPATNGPLAEPPILSWRRELRLAVVRLTRLRLRLDPIEEAWPAVAAVRGFPLVGAGIGALGAGSYALSEAAGLGASISALVAIGAMAALTGGAPEAGLAETADGLARGRSTDERLALIRDGEIGAPGMLAMILVVLLRVEALALAVSPTEAGLLLIAAAGSSRAAMVLVMRLNELAPPRPANAEPVDRRRSVDALALGALVVVPCLDFATAAVAVAVVLMVGLALSRIARRRLGGYTVEVLGAAQHLAVVGVLLCFVAVPGWVGWTR